MQQSRTGVAWQTYYETNELSWCIPSKVSKEYIQQYIKSEWIQKILDLTGLQPSVSSTVLEAGCGTGLFSLCLAILGFQVDAFDYNKGALHFAQQLEGKALQINPNLIVCFSEGNLLDIQADTDTFDLVFNQAVMEYFVDIRERKKAVSEMIRVAKPGGWIVMIVQHTGHPFGPLWKQLGWKGYTNQPSVRLCTPKTISQELQEAGLSQVNVDGIYPWKAFFFWPPWFKRFRWTYEFVYLLGRFLDKFIPLPKFLRRSLALQIIAVGQKP
jgi:SAM-dependent methyltransferase